MSDAQDVAEALRELADDWERYGLMKPPEWGEEMRRCVVVELRVLVERMDATLSGEPRAGAG